MRKFNTFLHVLKNSAFPTPKYYKKIIKAPFFFSFSYFFCLIGMIIALSLMLWIIKKEPKIQDYNFFKKSIIRTLSDYPDGLEVTIKNGLLKSNYERPYVSWLHLKNGPHPFIVVDERAPSEKINQYNSLLLLNRNGFVTKQEGKVLLNKYDKQEKITVTKKNINDLSKSVNNFFFLIPLTILSATPLFIAFITTIAVVKKIAFLALISSVIFLISRFFVKKISFKNTLQISLHAITVPLLVEFFITSLGAFMQSNLMILALHTFFVITAVYQTYLVKE